MLGPVGYFRFLVPIPTLTPAEIALMDKTYAEVVNDKEIN
jgi:hypothetical protein